MKNLKVIANKLWDWLKGLELEGILGLILGLYFLSQSMEFWAGIAIGVFATKNWDMIKEWIKEKFKL